MYVFTYSSKPIQFRRYTQARICLGKFPEPFQYDNKRMFPPCKWTSTSFTPKKQLWFWKWIITRKNFKHLNDLKRLQSNHFFLSESQELVIFNNIFIIAIEANYPIYLKRKIGNHLNYISLPTKETIRNNLQHSIRLLPFHYLSIKKACR